MKKIILSFILVSILCLSQAQDRSVKEMQVIGTKAFKSLDSNGWNKVGTFIFNINQGTLSNWAAGGEQSVLGINWIFNYALNLRSERNTWDNGFDIALGFQNATSFGKFRKIDDRIDITSKYGFQISKKGYLGILTNFNSQALAGYDYSDTPNTKISSFLTPGKILLSPGFDYKPNNKFSFYISPLTIRWVLKNNPAFFNSSKFGVDSAQKVNTELGAFFTAKASLKLAKWATYNSRLDLFSNYKRKAQNVDLLMNNLLTMKFNKILSTNISLDLIYDDDVIKRLQVKEILGVGLILKL
jgi:hypothetical protein